MSSVFYKIQFGNNYSVLGMALKAVRQKELNIDYSEIIQNQNRGSDIPKLISSHIQVHWFNLKKAPQVLGEISIILNK